MHRSLCLIAIALAGCESGSATPAPLMQKAVVAKLAEKPNQPEQFTKETIGRAAVETYEQSMKQKGLKTFWMSFMSNIFVDELKSKDGHRRWIVIAEVFHHSGPTDVPMTRDHFFSLSAAKMTNGFLKTDDGSATSSDFSPQQIPHLICH